MGTDAFFGATLWDRPVDERREVAAPRRPPRQARYDELVRRMKREHRVRVVRWRSRNTGCAWQVSYADGCVSRLIEAPYPRGPVSAAVFLHEIGHHAIGFYRYKLRCYEEYMAWQWSLATMRAWGLNVTDRLEGVVDHAMRYAVSKAIRRGIKQMPVELVRYLPRKGATRVVGAARLSGPHRPMREAQSA